MSLLKYIGPTLTFVALFFFMMWPISSVTADEASTQIRSTNAISEFPNGIRFNLKLDSDDDIVSIALRFTIGTHQTGVFEYMEFTPITGRSSGKTFSINSQLFWRTNTASRYIPPGTIISYSFEIENSEGEKLFIDPEFFTYHDSRYQWDEITQGPITVSYHGPVKSRAELMLNTMLETLNKMGPLLGAEVDAPVRATMYNNVKEMLVGLPPGSETIRRELITEGQAFIDVGTILIHGGGNLSIGTASHELIHILTHRAGDSVFRKLPAWLDEGLAEYGNVQQGFSYDVALEFALANNRLLPITKQIQRPGTPEEVIIFYGEASSIVKFMVDNFGSNDMKKLMATLKSGKNIDDAFQTVYELSPLDMENLWRRNIGAPEYIPPQPGTTLPTPVPRPTLLPYSLTPQPQEPSKSREAEVSTPEKQQVDQEVTVTSPTPGLDPTPSPASKSVAETQNHRIGSSCNRNDRIVSNAVDVSTIGLMMGLVGLVLRRRIGI